MAHEVQIINGMSNVQADDLMLFVNDLLDGNSGVVDVNDYVVTQSSPLAKTVLVGIGESYIYVSSLASYVKTLLTSPTTLTIDPNTSGSTRVDLIAIKIDPTISPDANGTNVASLQVVKGTPGAGAPTLPANHYQIASLSLVDSFATVTNAMITDSRTLIKVLLNSLKFKELSVLPGTPIAGQQVVYAKASDGKIYRKQSSGVETEFGAGGGGGSTFWTDVPGTPVRVSNLQFTITDTGNANSYDQLFKKGVVLKWTESGTFKTGMVISSSYASNVVTINIIGDALGATFTALKYSIRLAMIENFIIPGTFPSAAITDISKTFFAPFDMYPLGVDFYVKTAGTTNATTIDLNDDGTTIITTKPSIASGSTLDIDNTVDAASTAILAQSLLTIDVDAIATTPPVDGYVYFYYYPKSWRYRT